MRVRPATVGAFEHRVVLPDGVDPATITASMENGVLSLIVPKPANARPRSIPIETGDRAKELTAA